MPGTITLDGRIVLTGRPASFQDLKYNDTRVQAYFSRNLVKASTNAPTYGRWFVFKGMNVSIRNFSAKVSNPDLNPWTGIVLQIFHTYKQPESDVIVYVMAGSTFVHIFHTLGYASLAQNFVDYHNGNAKAPTIAISDMVLTVTGVNGNYTGAQYAQILTQQSSYLFDKAYETLYPIQKHHASVVRNYQKNKLWTELRKGVLFTRMVYPPAHPNLDFFHSPQYRIPVNSETVVPGPIYLWDVPNTPKDNEEILYYNFLVQALSYNLTNISWFREALKKEYQKTEPDSDSYRICSIVSYAGILFVRNFLYLPDVTYVQDQRAVEAVESFNDLTRRNAGDCEDMAQKVCSVLKILRDTVWTNKDLQECSRFLKNYEPIMVFGGVTSAKLDDMAGARMVENLGYHMWAMLVAKEQLRNMLIREYRKMASAHVDVALDIAAIELPDTKDRLRYVPPAMFLEGTGALCPDVRPTEERGVDMKRQLEAMMRLERNERSKFLRSVRYELKNDPVDGKSMIFYRYASGFFFVEQDGRNALGGLFIDRQRENAPVYGVDPYRIVKQDSNVNMAMYGFFTESDRKLYHEAMQLLHVIEPLRDCDLGNVENLRDFIIQQTGMEEAMNESTINEYLIYSMTPEMAYKYFSKEIRFPPEVKVSFRVLCVEERVTRLILYVKYIGP